MPGTSYRDDELRNKLTPEQFRVLREHSTETPGTGTLLHETRPGEYHCPVCGALLFMSDTKYESTTPGLVGWPSFSEVAASDAVKPVDDTSLGMCRMEVRCAQCDSHLGHLFDDPASPNGKHYCINSAALQFSPKDD